MIWSAPLQVIFGLVFLFRTLGISVLSGVAMTILFMPMNIVSGKLAQKFQVKDQCIENRTPLMDRLHNGQNFEKNLNRKIHYQSINICRHHTYPCGWLGADVVADLSRY